MLEGLDRVPWAEVNHAYGSAADVPELLRMLASDEPDQREDALGALYGNIWHQGTVYEATSHAVPFLIEIAADPSLEDRADVLGLLFMLAHGYSYIDVHRHLDFAGEHLRADPNFEANLAKELDWVRLANEAVVAGHPRYLVLLDDPDPEVRRHAAKMLSVCHRAASDVVPLLIERSRTTDPVLLASILFALAKLDPLRARPLLEQGLEAKEGLVRLSAALGLSLFQEKLAPKTGQVLVHHLTHLDDVDYELFPFGDDQGADIATALTRADAEARMGYAEVLLENAEAGRAAIFSVATPLLALAFDKPLEHPTLESLNSTQRRVLEFIAHRAWENRNGTWSMFINFVDYLRAYGLEELGEEVTGYSRS